MPGIVAVWKAEQKPNGNPGVSQALRVLDFPGCLPPSLIDCGPCQLGSVLQSYLPEDSLSAPLSPGISLVADCRLDNRPELARLLEITAPEELCDTAFLTAAWQKWGERCVEYLTGTFAFIVWDQRQQVLFAARDALGECPLFFYRSADVVAIASRSKALFPLAQVPVRFNDEHIAHWLALNLPVRGASFFADIRAIPPGGCVRFTQNRTEVRQYWHPSDVAPIRFRKDQDYALAMRDVLDHATAVRLRSRGQVSAQLSSGLDSSSVATSAALQLALLGRELTAYTAVPQAGFSGKHPNSNVYYDEGPFAAEVAAMYPNMRHVRVSSEGRPLLSTIQRWVDVMDEPVLNGTNIVWIDAILALCRQNGSDIMFQGTLGNGNISYETLRILAVFLRQGRWLPLARTIYQHRASGFMSFRQLARVAFQDFIPARLSGELERQRASFSLNFSAIHPQFAEEQRVRETTMERHIAREPDTATERRELYERFDMGPLNHAFRALHQVDPRDPTYDKNVWDYTYAIPDAQFVAEGHSRSLIRRAMRGRLPANTLARYGRGAQGADWYMNLRAALPAFRAELEAQERSPAACRYLDLPRLKQLVETFPLENFHRAAVFESYHYALVRGVTLGYFLRTNDPALTS